MKHIFCNPCSISEQIPRLIAEDVLGIENLSLLNARYEQMRKCYDFSYEQWQSEFTEDLKTFRGYSDTTAVTMQIRHQLFKQDFERIGKGSIGLDLPTWFNIQNNNPPTTGDGIQNLSNRLTLFFIKVPIINKIIAKIKVKVISKSKEYKKSPTLYIVTCT
jgi:hypothetical protein